jgi:hypothetical protein
MTIRNASSEFASLLLAAQSRTLAERSAAVPADAPAGFRVGARDAFDAALDNAEADGAREDRKLGKREGTASARKVAAATAILRCHSARLAMGGNPARLAKARDAALATLGLTEEEIATATEG